MNGVITLLTDFGDSYYPAVMKGVILSHCFDLQLIDVTHELPAFGLYSSAFILSVIIKNFSMPAVHLVVVDPGVGTDRNAIAVSIGNGSFIVGPDNGVLSWAIQETGYEARKIIAPEGASMTFHGRDVFAPVAAELACDPEYFSSLGEKIAPLRLPFPGFKKISDKIHAGVLFTDPFGNVIVSVHKNDHVFDTKKRLILLIEDRIYDFEYGTYGKIGPDRLCWHYDSSGYVELSVDRGNFARLSGLGVKDDVILTQ